MAIVNILLIISPNVRGKPLADLALEPRNMSLEQGVEAFLLTVVPLLQAEGGFRKPLFHSEFMFNKN